MDLKRNVWYCIKGTDDSSRRDLMFEYVMGVRAGVFFKSVSGVDRNVSLYLLPMSKLEDFREQIEPYNS